MSEKDVSKGIKLIEINKYIVMCLKADPIFFYSDEVNRSNILTYAVEWGEFFHNKETM